VDRPLGRRKGKREKREVYQSSHLRSRRVRRIGRGKSDRERLVLVKGRQRYFLKWQKEVNMLTLEKRNGHFSENRRHKALGWK